MRHLTVPVLLVLGSAGLAHAQDLPPPICAKPTVLHQVDSMLRQAGRPMRLWPMPIGEISTEPTRIVHCAARGQMLGYDTNRYGTQPINDVFVVHYTLELRHNGIFIRLQ